MDCWCLLRYDPSRPPIVTGAPATMDVAAPSATIPVKGANFAPTAENLRCGFGGFGAHGQDSATDLSVQATFVAGGAISCPPPHHWWQVAHLHVTHDYGESWSVEPVPIQLYNSSQLALVSAVEPKAIALVHEQASVALVLRGSHFFRPDAVGGGPRGLSRVCRYQPLPEGRVLLAPATVTDGTHATCATPVPLMPMTAAVALSFDGGATYGTAAMVTFYDERSPASLVAVDPPDGESQASTPVRLIGVNFKPPTTADALVCRFGAEEAFGTFVDSAAIACQAPAAALVGAVRVSLSTDGGNTWPVLSGGELSGGETPKGLSAALDVEVIAPLVTYVYYDSSLGARLSGVTPAAAPITGGMPLTLIGSNFVPTTEEARHRAATVTPLGTTVPARRRRALADDAEEEEPQTAQRWQQQEQPWQAQTQQQTQQRPPPPQQQPPQPPPQPQERQLHPPHPTQSPHPPHPTQPLHSPHRPHAADNAAAVGDGAPATAAAMGEDMHRARGGKRKLANWPIGADTAPLQVLIGNGTRGHVTYGRAVCLFSASGVVLGATPASFMSFAQATCFSPPVRSADSDATIKLVSADGLVSLGVPFTFYNASAPPIVSRVVPYALQFGAPPTTIEVYGSGFAPMQLLCHFTVEVHGAKAERWATPATFKSTSLVLCTAPAIPHPANLHELLLVPLAITRDGVRSPAKLEGVGNLAAVEYYDRGGLPATIAAVPLAVDIRGGAKLMVSGSSFHDGGASMHCVVGHIHVPARFVSRSAVACEVPMAEASWVGANATQPVCVMYVDDEKDESGGGAVVIRRRYSDFCGAHVTYYDPTRPPTFTALEPRLAPLHTPTVVALFGTNMCPTGAELVCRFGSIDRPPLPASFVAGDQVRCEAPAVSSPSTAIVSVSCDGGTTWSSTGLAVLFAYYDPTKLPTLVSFSPTVGDTAGGTLIRLTGSNYAPTAGFACQFGALPPTPATYLNTTSAVCLTPPSPKVQTLELHLSLDSTQPSSHTSHEAKRFTFYAAAEPPTVIAISSGWGETWRPLLPPVILTVTGTNFAPTPNGELQCLFEPLVDEGAREMYARMREMHAPPRELEVDLPEPPPPAIVPATYVSVTTIRCAVPPMPTPCTAAVSASHGKINGTAAFGPSLASYTYYDALSTPIVSSLSPAYTPSDESRTITLYGSNFNPKGGMMVRFGQIGRPVPATFVSVTSARVKSPLPPREGRECAQFNSASRSPCISLSVYVEVSAGPFTRPPLPVNLGPSMAEGGVFTWCARVPLSAAECRRVLPSATECHRVRLMTSDLQRVGLHTGGNLATPPAHFYLMIADDR